nr:hypothetical protein [Tanacetum cinerariifolium]
MSRCIEKFRDVKKRVIDLEDELKKIKTTQQNKIDSLEKRVKNLEKKYNSRTHKLKSDVTSIVSAAPTTTVEATRIVETTHAPKVRGITIHE